MAARRRCQGEAVACLLLQARDGRAVVEFDPAFLQGLVILSVVVVRFADDDAVEGSLAA
jgi:hypothetical protein